MAKDPAFLFYSSDFLTGVQDLTFEERGQYITLLCIEHQKGRLSDKLIKLSVGNATADVMAKFKQDDNGLYYNSRLEEETDKRKQHSEKQRVRAIEGWKKRKDNKSHGIATAMPLENEIENRNEIINSYIADFPNSSHLEVMMQRTGHKKEEILKAFNDFKTKCEFNYPNFDRFCSHFNNWYAKRKTETQQSNKTTLTFGKKHG